MIALEEALGRQIRPDERRSIESLNDLEPRHLEEAALLLRSSRIDAALYLQMLVRRSQLDDVADFLADVVSGGADAKTWRIRDLICVVHVSLPWLTELTVARVKELLAQVEGRRWFRVAARRAQWDDSPFCGAPGVLVERAPYWWSGPDATNYSVAMSSDIELVTDVPTAVRRWLASRIAWELRGERPRSVDAVVSRLRASPPSEDARAAIAALLREDDGPADGLAPGFHGPDADYVHG